MLLGLMSLLLSATEEYLVKICVKDKDYTSYYPPPGNLPADDSYPPPVSRRSLLMDGLDVGARSLQRLSTFPSFLASSEGGPPSTTRVVTGRPPQ